MEEYFERQAQLERDMCFRHPWFNFMYNWLIAILIVALFVSFGKWGWDIHTRNAHEAGMQEVYAAMDAEHEAMLAAAADAEKQAQQAEAELQIREAKAIARAFFGIRNFTAKYGYTSADLETYARCITNRSEATGRSVEEVLAEKGQFLAYSEHNDLETENYNLALRFAADWHDGKLPACDTKFRYAVLNEYGIWLVDDPGKTVPERWHA